MITQIRILEHHDGTRVLQYCTKFVHPTYATNSGGAGAMGPGEGNTTFTWTDVPVVKVPKPESNL